MFDPWTDVPTTDDEVMIALVRDDVLTTALLQGLYRIFRGRGMSLLDAYEKTLLAYIEACEQAGEQAQRQG